MYIWNHVPSYSDSFIYFIPITETFLYGQFIFGSII